MNAYCTRALSTELCGSMWFVRKSNQSKLSQVQTIGAQISAYWFADVRSQPGHKPTFTINQPQPFMMRRRTFKESKKNMECYFVVEVACSWNSDTSMLPKVVLRKEVPFIFQDADTIQCVL